jgi:hypothetical protein
MIRSSTLLCLLLAAGSGLYLYSTKHRAQLLDRDIAHLMKAADVARERTGVLRAEYALLSDPQRLKDLASEHLALRPTEPTQFTTWADFAKRLPPLGLPPSADLQPIVEAPPPTPDGPPAPVAVPVAQAEPVRAPAPHPDAHVEPARPPVLAAARPPLATPNSLTAALVSPTLHAIPPAVHSNAPTRSVLAAAHDAPGPEVSSMALPPPSAYRAAPPPFVSTVATGPRLGYQPPPVTTAEAVARIARGGPIDASVPVVGSALGMARSMMRVPTAVAPANAAQAFPLGNGG